MTTAQTRTGLAIPTVTGSDPFTELKDGIRRTGQWLETNGAMWAEGADSARPAAGTHGRFYKPTDISGVIYWDNGTTWETIGGSAATDAAPGVGSLRTLGSGANQAAPGDTTAAAVAQLIAADLRDWALPGLEVPGVTTTVTTVTAGPTTVVAAPSGSGRRVVKNIILATAAAGSVATITWAGLTLGTIVLPAGVTSFDVCLPCAVSEPLQVTVSGGTLQVLALWGDRTDSLVQRLGYLSSSSVSGTLIATGTTRTITSLWLANNSSSTAAVTSLSVGGTVVLPTLTMPARSILALDSPVEITNAQAVTFVGDGTNAITYLAVGR